MGLNGFRYMRPPRPVTHYMYLCNMMRSLWGNVDLMSSMTMKQSDPRRSSVTLLSLDHRT
eukprot:56849-Eustigmatos_ZCMA.PRE.1